MINTSQVTEATQASFSTLFGLGSHALDGVEKLAALNLQVGKTLLTEFANDATALLSVTSPDDLVKLQTAAMQAAPQKAASYAWQVQDILSAAATAQSEAVQTQVAELQAWFLDSVHGLFKDAPGTENAVALMKSAIVAANNAYDGVQQASKQVSDAVAVNITKLTAAA